MARVKVTIAAYVEVEATSEEEAIDKAMERSIDWDDFEENIEYEVEELDEEDVKEEEY